MSPPGNRPGLTEDAPRRTSEVLAHLNPIYKMQPMSDGRQRTLPQPLFDSSFRHCVSRKARKRHKASTKLAGVAHRSRFPLREIKLTTRDTTLDGFRTLLRPLPESVNHLEFVWQYDMRVAPILRLLEVLDRLPNLRLLVLKAAESPSGHEYQALVDLLRARMRRCGHLARVYLSKYLHSRVGVAYNKPQVPDTVIMQLQELGSEGMNIQFEVSAKYKEFVKLASFVSGAPLMVGRPGAF
ncbi:hypothetical protein FB45DRAFT_874622 [Roridomyces roridus]|uniref:Uncharacterized protein n=1 Tax=Roridomyces roridus TaxID=1738132 RepID=A0AAD7B7R5_9AGAR|nr:hypothetical protein FB45DRAFT_874622 [Roridomyces roridus]